MAGPAIGRGLMKRINLFGLIKNTFNVRVVDGRVNIRRINFVGEKKKVRIFNLGKGRL